MGLIAPKTFPPLHADPAIDAMQMDVVGVADNGAMVVKETTTISRMESMSMNYSGDDLTALRRKTASQAATKYALCRMHDRDFPFVKEWWYRESGGKTVDITEAIKKLQVRVG